MILLWAMGAWIKGTWQKRTGVQVGKLGGPMRDSLRYVYGMQWLQTDVVVGGPRDDERLNPGLFVHLEKSSVSSIRRIPETKTVAALDFNCHASNKDSFFVKYTCYAPMHFGYHSAIVPEKSSLRTCVSSRTLGTTSNRDFEPFSAWHVRGDFLQHLNVYNKQM